MSRIDYLRIYSDADGCSHFEVKNVGLETKGLRPTGTAFVYVRFGIGRQQPFS